MSIKDLFGKTSNKVVDKAELDKLDDEVESFDVISANTDKNNLLIPRVDYSKPENFAHYGSAEKYYEDSINHILKSYPYDGSQAEKMRWRNDASGLDEYILDYLYPSSVGHVKLNSSVAAATTYSDTGSGVWYRYAANTGQHITIKGGPNKDPSANEGDEYELSKQFPPKGGKANLWDDEMFRESNLGINPSYGNTIEFWAKRDALLATTQSICLFDLWNGAAHSAANYTRFTISVPGSPSSAGTHFHVTYKYGNAAEGVEEAGLTIPADTLATMGATSGATWMQNWHHYAFVVSNTDSGIKVDLYIDGTYSTTVTAGNKITSTISQEAFIANINALRTKPLASSPAALADGDGGAKGLYLDEFRYWKKARNAKEIGRYWFTPIFGGTNTDNTKYDKEAGTNIDLGVYYKFNEGVYDSTTANATDAQCLDYSGRISNGTISNYSTDVRATTSAMDESAKVIEMGVTEPKDPTMYATHSDIQTLKANLMLEGSSWDMQNNASFYHTMPAWILDEDQNGMVIKTLVQTLSSYFDTIHSQIDMLGQIREAKYFDLGDSQTKPVFFAKQLLRSVGFDVVDIFNEATSIEEITSRAEQEMFENRIQDIKNVIYQNIYNNISYIYKTKGTQKSFRNLIRCFGVDDELIKLNLYADGVDYELGGRRAHSSVKKNYIDFNHVDRHDGVAYSKDVYGSSLDERGYVAGVTTDQAKLLSTTMTAQVIFPLQLERDHPSFQFKDFTTISLFGCKEANISYATTTLTFDTTNYNSVNNGTIALIDAAGTSVTYKIKNDFSATPSSQEFNAGGSKAAAAENLAQIIEGANGHNGTIHATDSAGVRFSAGGYNFSDGVVKLKQATFGTAGNTTVTTAASFDSTTSVNVSNFSGAYELYDQTGTNQIGRMQVQAIMGSDENSSSTRDTTSARFKLIYTDADGDHELVSDEYKDVWENSTWNFGVRIVPTDSELGDYVTGATATKYSIDWYGVQLQLGEVQNEFKLNAFYNGATPVAKARAMIATPKIFYIGHYRDNFAINTGILKSDVKVTDLQYWFDKLEVDEVKIHATDVTNTGRMYPNDDAYAFFSELSDGTVADIRVPRKDTLALHWDFSNNLKSDASGEFVIDDISGGGASYITEARYGWFTNLVGYRHTGLATFDSTSVANDTNVINREYAYSAIHRLPEVLSGDDMVEIRTQDDDVFGKGSKPINHFWAIEKSMYQVVSQEMLSLFAGIMEFNDLIGQPVNRYRMEYKTLQKFRSLFYERVENVPSFEKFVSFYKWLDSSVGLMVQQLIPASGNFSESMRNMIENHLLERSKYWTKFPTLEMKQDPPAATLRGIREMTYDWEHGHAPISAVSATATVMTDSGSGLTGLTLVLKNADGSTHTITGAALGAGNPSTATQFNVDEIGHADGFAAQLKASLDAAATAGNIKMSVSAITNNTGGAPRVITLSQTQTGITGNTLITGTLIDGNKLLINNTNAVTGGHGTKAFTGGGADSPDHCLWWNERAERTWDGFYTPAEVDADREKIRKSNVRDVLGQNKMVKVSTGGYVEQGEPTLYDIATSKHYEGSTYATRRLSRPYKLNLDQAPIITGGPNFANATPASPNDMMRASTRRGHNIQITSLQDDAEACQDEYGIQDGPIVEKRRSHIVTLADTVLSVTTPLKGSLITHPRYGTYPNDASVEWRNVHHDSYGQDHEIPMQGVFAAEWVGGNQHRHIDLNRPTGCSDPAHTSKEACEGAGETWYHDVETNRPELYKVTGGNTIKHPHDVNTDHPAARWTRDGTAKRPFNIANVNTAVNEDNYTTYTGTPKLGNYTRDYEIVQTSGRSINNRWHVKNPAYTPNSIVSTYVTGLYDFTLPDRTKNSANETFGRTEHIFVERFSAPGGPATLSRGALDIQAEEYSAYNSLNFRNLRVRNHLNFWHKEHTAQFGYREDYIHGTESDAIGGVSNDFGGNTANVGAWHKNNRNPLTRMHLQGGSIQQPFCLDPSYTTETDCTGGSSTWTTPSATIESRRRYDNFYVSHQIPQSDWQYHWITSSAVHFNISGQPELQEYDDEMRAAYTPTTFPWNNDGDADAADKFLFHPRLSGYITDYPNATIGVSGSLDHLLSGGSTAGLLPSGSVGISYTNGATTTNVAVDIDFVYGNYAFVDDIDWANNLVGTTCPVCTLNRPIEEFGGTSTNQKVGAGNSSLNALLLNRNGPYQGASWKMLQNAYNPIVRQQRKRNVVTIQDVPDSNKLYEDIKEAMPGGIRLTINSVPSGTFTITADPLIPDTSSVSTDTVTVNPAQFSGTDAQKTVAMASFIAQKINELDENANVASGDGVSKISASYSEGMTVVYIWTEETGKIANTKQIVLSIPDADVALSSGNMTNNSSIVFSMPDSDNENPELIGTSATGIQIASSGGTSTITVKFQNGSDEKKRTWRYNDRRSDAHSKYYEPAATWNMPMTHLLSEKSDNIGVTAVHSYSNNLKTFANPKLSFRTGVGIKSTHQNYDVLFEKYSPFSATQPSLDFVGLSYKEYIFPKSRNVGLLKTRVRASWDDLSSDFISSVPTGELRIFWKDNYFDRIKGSRQGTVNALGFSAPWIPSYLLTDGDGSGSLDSHRQVRSIFAMDNFVFDAPDPIDTSSQVEWRCKGDLQYVGWETYMSWIVNRSCQYTPNTDFVNYNNIEIGDLFSTQTIVTNAGMLSWKEVEANAGLGKEYELYTGGSAPGKVAQQSGNGVSMATAGTKVVSKTQVRYNKVSAHATAYTDMLAATYDGGKSLVIGGSGGGKDTVKVVDDLKMKDPALQVADLAEQRAFDTPTAAVATRADISPRCSPPEVVAQLYYNPHGEEKREGAWRYTANEMAGKNPWYNNYADFSLETRCMAQNYGTVAEFRVSEHMDKYLMVDSGDFRTKNFNFLSLHGASYNTVAPHYSTFETAWSGKVTYPTEKVYSIDGTMENVVTAFPHSDEIYSGWQQLSIDSDESQEGLSYLQNRIKTMNIAFSSEEGRGTFNNPSPYVDYALQNPIHAGGDMAIENSTLAYYAGSNTGAQVLATTPWTGRVSWGDGDADDGTGRHRWFAAKETLSESETSAYRGTDDDGNTLFGYDDDGVTQSTDPTVRTDLPPVYREANSFTDWKSILPFSNDAGTSDSALASLKFNMDGAMHEFMHGQITMWDKFTTSSPNDTNIYGIQPFGKMVESTHWDTLRVPSDAAAGGNKTQARKELYGTSSDVVGTPTTISIWAKPEKTVCSMQNATYDNIPVGLYVFGSYGVSHEQTDGSGNISTVKEVSTVNQQEPGRWRRDIVEADGDFGMYANFPAPESLRDSYPLGMGLTFFMNKKYQDNKTKTEMGFNAVTPHDDFEGFDKQNIYHFFKLNTQGDPDDATKNKWVPAVLTEGEWSNVVLQILPAVGSNPPKIKLTLTDSKTRPSSGTGSTSADEYYSEVLYGIHRSALTNGTYKKAVYSTVPVGRTTAWGTNYGWGGPDFSKVLAGYSFDYKIGKAIFPDRKDHTPLNLKRRSSEQFWYFHGELMEFSMWSGVLSKADVDWIRAYPRNLLEGYLNGEVLGGYTNTNTSAAEWGATSPIGTLTTSNLTNGTVAAGTTNTGYTQTAFTLSEEASRSTCKLPVWHRLGVHPTINIEEACEDWDDEFFNSYVHTDTIQFYDAIVEDHDGISPTARKRIRFKVNALKKLIPYRGFYPQDRTLQLAQLFMQKMSDSVTGADETVLLKEQTLQAAMQPFFAPGILYNSIKAGMAVDWPVFTNETGLEPVYPNSQCALPYYSEDILGVTSDQANPDDLARGPEVRLSSIVPNWYSPRSVPTSPNEGLLVEYERYKSVVDDDEEVEVIAMQQVRQCRTLYDNQPKFFGISDINADTAKGGYVIRQTPNMRIPFEGLVSLDSVLPTAGDSYADLGTTIDEGDFKYVDLEISGWDCEGVEISFMQPEAGLRERHNPDTYPDGDDWTDNYMMRKVSVTIGDPSREMGSTDWDVEVDFQRPPTGFGMPKFDQSGGTDFADHAPQWTQGKEPISLDDLNEEIAVKLCREINRRNDIHYVAVPGYHTWQLGPTFEMLPAGPFGTRKGNVTDDLVHRIFPACYPEIFGIAAEDINPPESDTDMTAANARKTFGAARTHNLWSNESLWKQDQFAPPAVGKQNNGTWRIRVVYVGPPRIRLNMSEVALDHTEMSHSANQYNIEANGIHELGMRPYDGIHIDEVEAAIAMMEGSGGYSTPYDSTNPKHYNTYKAGSGAFINSQQRCLTEDDIDSGNRSEDGVARHWIREAPQDGGGAHWDFALGWKALHLINPFKDAYGVDGAGDKYPDEVSGLGYSSQVKVPTYWMRPGTIEPTSFFTGGGTPATTMIEGVVLGDACSLSITRHLGTLALCRWIDGYGWKGSAKYSIDTELGVRQVDSNGVTRKGNYNDGKRNDTVTGEMQRGNAGNKDWWQRWNLSPAFRNAKDEWREDESLGVASSFVSGQTASGTKSEGSVVVMEESAKPQQGPFYLYGGYTAADITQIRVTPKPHQIYLMTPEYYVGHQHDGGGGTTGVDWAANWKNYCYPYFEYQGNNGDPRFEMAMHNFLAEVPNFFLRDNKLVSFASKPESEFKVMEAGKTYYMSVSMNQSDNFTMVASPYSDIYSLGRPSKIAFGETSTSVLTMEGRYFGPAFQWKGLEDYNDDNSLEKQMLRDPAQAPYVPPYLYGKQTARISFTASETKKYTLEEIFAGATVDNISAETWQRFIRCAQEDSSTSYYNSREILSSPAWKARTTLSASMNLFGKTSIKQVEYSAQMSWLRDDLDESLQKFVPQTATDQSENADVWTIGTKWECPILNFYTAPALTAMQMPAINLDSDEYTHGSLAAWAPSVIGQKNLQLASSGNGYVIKDSAEEGENSGTGIWSSYGTVPSETEGVFITIEESTLSSATKDASMALSRGSLIDVCGFKAQQEKVGEIAPWKEVSEAVVMIPFVDKPSETTAETITVDGRHFFKINKDLFNLQKQNIEAGYPAVRGMQWFGVTSNQEIQETSISRMIKMMKKYNIPPKFDFVRYPMEASENPFVMYIFEFNHRFNRQDLSDIWQGLPPRIALTAEHDSATILHDLSPVDFFEENTLPRHVRWMTFKVKKRAKEDYFEATASGVDDGRFTFDFEIGKTAPKYSYNWPYDYFTMLELVQVEAGIDIVENKLIAVPQVTSSQDEISSSDMRRQIQEVKSGSKQDLGAAPMVHTFGTDEDR